MGDGFGLQIVVVGVGACAVFDVWQRIFPLVHGDSAE